MKKVYSLFLICGAIINILGGIFHFLFWYLFNWKATLASLDWMNRNIMLMLNYCLGAFFFLLGILLIVLRKEVLTSLLGKALLLTLSIVYAIRLVFEIILPGTSCFWSVFLIVIICLFLFPTLSVKNN